VLRDFRPLSGALFCAEINMTKLWRTLDRNWTLDRQVQWFLQDGANPHVSARSVVCWLTEHFEDRMISRRSQHAWAPHSPDLNPCDFFMRGFCKDKIFANQFEDIGALKQVITGKTCDGPLEKCAKPLSNFKRRIKIKK